MKKVLFLLVFFISIFYIFPQNINEKKDILIQANNIISILENHNFEMLSGFIDKEAGLYVAENICTDINHYNHLTMDELKNNNKVYPFYIDDDPSERWETSIKSFLSSTFNINSEKSYKLSFNSYISKISWGLTVKDISDIFGDCIFVEYYYEPSGKYGDLDWESIYIVFKKINNEYKLIGLTCNYNDI